MVNLEFSLSGSWKFKGFAGDNEEQSRVHKIEYDDRDWLVGLVPGTIHTDLMANNIIPDPFYDLNEKEVQWVADNEWWYRKEFDLAPEVLNKQAIELVFEGLDTFATVWVNDVAVGEAHNMFTPWRFSIKNAVKAGKNLIAIKFKPVQKIAYKLEEKYRHKYACLCKDYCSARPYVRKAQYSFGWDWGPILPTAGIWRDIKIVAYDNAILGYFTALPIEVSDKKAKVKLIAEIYTSKNSTLKTKFVLEGFGQKFEHEINIQARKGRSYADCIVEVSKPELWWPRGYGEPKLYKAKVEVFSGNKFVDKALAEVGIRSIQLLQEHDEEGTSFIFVINGVKIFCKGANWVPADSFLPRVTAQKYNQLLNISAHANFNMLRVWGGGIYEKDEFYDLCDSLGILVWQDFMFACAGYPEEDWFLSEVKREAEDVVLRLRGHPCIVLWCGNNENQWLQKIVWKDRDQSERLLGLPIYETILPEVCQRLDSTRPYRLSDPFGGDDFSGKYEGHRHNWEVWSQGIDYTEYLEDNGRFLTEFGWQAPPTMRLLKTYLDKKDLNLKSEAFQAHEKQTGGLDLLKRLLAIHFPVPSDLNLFVLYSQLDQADALKTAIMHWRSRMFKTSGCLIWQLNDCWPVISWSIIDYELNPKPAYYQIKRVFQPVIAPLIIKQGKVYAYVVNETSKDLELTFNFKIIRFNGGSQYAENKEVFAPAYSSLLVLKNPLNKLPIADDTALTVDLKENGVILYEDSKTAREPKDLQLPEVKVRVDAKKLGNKSFQISLKSSVYAKAVYLDMGDLAGTFEDNFFDIIPNSPKNIKCILKEDTSLSKFKQTLKFQSYPYH